MSREREAKLEETLGSYKNSETTTLLKELLTLRRKRWRDKLEKEESDQIRGKSLECRDILAIFD